MARPCLACDQHIPPDHRVDAKYCGLRCKARASSRRYDAKHRAEAAERARLWSAKNPERNKANTQAWRKRNPEKARCLWTRARARGRAVKLQALPKWLSPEQLLEIRDYYQQAVAATKMWGIDHVVDHIVPLCGATVCGLHVPWNLQVLTRLENSQKGNTLQTC